MPGGLRARSARLFVKNEPSVKPVDFIWMEPDATEGGLKTVETDRFRFKIQLKTDGELKAAQVGLLLDGEFKPAREASLQRINSACRFGFSGRIRSACGTASCPSTG